eukprot:TRINITY_DN2290_c0_g1_i3.p2 TRINITY_DN2290_c0_g1~~TRINITY_DN2290_c0_g1_i3.p2  ORF type:complete len:135 (-),score=16.53 TRINITY_DN2290_c0_g1_i3:151-555(-)
MEIVVHEQNDSTSPDPYKALVVSRLDSTNAQSGRVIIDALPYIDGDYTPEMESHVTKLVEEEMKRIVRGEDVLEAYPAKEIAFSSEALQGEWRRMEAGGKMESVDLSRYSRVLGKVKSSEEGQEAIDVTKLHNW